MLRARSDGAGADVLVNDDDRRWLALEVGAGRWRPGPSAPMSRGDLAIGPHGERVLITQDRAQQLWLHVQGRRTRSLGRGSGEQLAVGDDGTIAVLIFDRARQLWLRTVDPQGHVSARRRLGSLRADADYSPDSTPRGPFLAVDARGHAHVAFNPPGTGATVVGPHGRRHLPGNAQALAVSPGGATAVLLQDDQTLSVAVDTR
jgi:hypothetical protein